MLLLWKGVSPSFRHGPHKKRRGHTLLLLNKMQKEPSGTPEGPTKTEVDTTRHTQVQIAMERTLVLIKPEGVMRGLIGEIISRLEKKGLNIAAMRLLVLSKSKGEALYSMHRTKNFFPILLGHMRSGPIIAMVVEGPDAINVVRGMIGATNPQEAAPGSIRADFALNKTQNIVHAADSKENADREISIFFEPSEILSYSKPTEARFLLGPQA